MAIDVHLIHSPIMRHSAISWPFIEKKNVCKLLSPNKEVLAGECYFDFLSNDTLKFAARSIYTTFNPVSLKFTK